MVGSQPSVYFADETGKPVILAARYHPFDLLAQPAAPDFPDTLRVTVSAPPCRYLAKAAIFDHLGQFMRSFEPSFGYRGELNNLARIGPRGRISYLVWDLQDRHGEKVGQGVYIWKVTLTFAEGQSQAFATRTGVLRRP